MPRKQAMDAKRKKIGLHILSVALLTIILVGGNVFLLLSPLFPVSSKENSSLVDRLVGNNILKSMEKSMVYVNIDTEIVHDKKVYNVLKELNGRISRYREIKGSEKSKKPILTLPSDSEMLGSVTSEDKTTAVFSVLHNPEFKFLSQKNPVGYAPSFVVPFIYNKNTNRVENISTEEIPDLNNESFSYRFMIPYSISKNNRYVAFEAFQCWNCGGHIPETRIYDTEKRVFQNLGNVLNFEWLEDGMYQFKPFIPEECGPGDGEGQCYKDPEKLLYKKGVMQK